MLGNDKNKNNNNLEYISLQDATRFCNYSQEYLSLRARQGKLKSVKLGRNWVTTKEWLVDYAGKVEEYNESVNNNGNGHKKDKAEKVIKEKIVGDRIAHFPPENLPIIRYPKFKLNLGTLRPGFAMALVLVLITVGGVFGKESLFATYNDVARSAEKIVRNLETVSDDVFAATISYKDALGWLKESYAVADEKVERKIGNALLTLVSADQIAEQKISESLLSLKTAYSSADKKVEQKISESLYGARIVLGQIRERFSDTGDLANNFVKQKLISIGQDLDNFENGFKSETMRLVRAIGEPFAKIYQSVNSAYKFVVSPWKEVVTKEESGKEVVVERIEVSKVVEPVKEVTRETIQQITRIDDAALAEVRANMTYLEGEIGKRLYAPGGVVSQTIFVTEPVSSPKIYQENGEIVLQTVGSGNVILSAATGLQLFGKQVTIESTSVLNPLIYLAANTKIDGDATIGGAATIGGNLGVGGTFTSGAATITGDLTVTGDTSITGDLTIIGNENITGVRTITASSTSAVLTVTQTGTGDILNLYDGGTEVFTVVDGGNVGIATTTPRWTFDVAGNAGFGTSTQSTIDAFGKLIVRGQWGGMDWYLNNDFGADINSVYSLAAYNGKLYAGLSGTNGEGDVYAYDGSAWSLSNDFGASINVVYSLAAYNGKLYAGLGNDAGEGDVYVFDGTAWSLSNDFGTSTARIFSLAAYNGKLYAGIGSGDVGGDVYVFDGTAWSLSNDFGESIDNIHSLAVYNGKLYAGLGSNAGEGDVYVFNGSTWSLSNDFGASIGRVASLAVYNGKLYAGLGFNNNSDGDVYVFDGTAWSLSNDFGTSANVVNYLAVYNGKLYAGLGSDAGEGDVYVFNGSTWSLSNDFGANIEAVYSLAVYNGKLYAGLGNSNGEADIYAFEENLGSQLANLQRQADYFSWTKAASSTIEETDFYQLNLASNMSIRDALGIATTTPRYKLDVWGDMAIGTSTGTNVPALYVQSGQGGRVGIGTTTLSTNLLTVGTTTPSLVVANNGYVGIGTTTPEYNLDVSSGWIQVSGSEASTGLIINDTTNSKRWDVTVNDGNFYIQETGIKTRLVIENGTGYVGIATTSPRYKLDVWGDMVIGTSTGVTAPMDYPLLFVNSGEGGSSNGVGIGTTTVSGTMLTVGTTTPALVVSQTGNVGIGTRTPNPDYDLHIFGGASPNINIESNSATGEPWIAFRQSDGEVAYFQYRDGGVYSTPYLEMQSDGHIYLNTVNNVGIATTSPRYKLDVWGDMAIGTSTNTNTPLLYVDSGDGYGSVGIGTTTLSGTLLTVGTTTPSLVVANNGYVGIGTTTPSNYLHVVANDNNTFMVEQMQDGYGTQVLLKSNGEQGGMFVYWPSDYAGLTYYQTVTGLDAAGINSKLLLRASDATGVIAFMAGGALASNERMRIDSSGNVGIATTTPRYKLDVWGDMAVGTSTDTNIPALYVDSGNGGRIGIGTTTLAGLLTVGTTTPSLVVTPNGNVGIGTTTSSNPLAVVSKNDLNYQIILDTSNSSIRRTGINFSQGGDTLMSIAAETGVAYPSAWIDAVQNIPLDFYTNDIIRIHIAEGGNVGIATTTPRYKLDVWGDFAVGTSTDTNTPLIYADSGNNGRVGIGTTTLSGLLTVGTTTPSLVVDPRGYVGIATTSPTALFSVAGDAYISGTLTVGGASSGNIQMQDDKWIGLGATAGRLLFDDQSPDYLTIQDANFGIGNTAPTSKLTVNGGDLAISSAGSATTTISSEVSKFAGGVISQASSTFTGDLTVNSDAYTSASLFVDASTGRVGLGTTTLAGLFTIGTSTQYFLIDPTGKTGVGATTTPSEQFAVQGNIAGTGNIILTGTSASSTIKGLIATGLNLSGNGITNAVWNATNIGLAYGGTGATLTDPNADRIMFWDDSLGATTWLTVGANLNLTDTTLSGNTSNWQYIGTNALRPTSTIGIIVSASSTFAGDLTVIGNSTTTGRFAAGGTLFVDQSTGYVGIGNTGPTSKLTVFGGDMVVSTAGSATTTISSGVSKFAGGIISQASSTFTNNIELIGDLTISSSTGSLYQPVYGSDDGLVLYLPFSEGMTSSSASIAYDRSPYGNDGTAIGMPMPTRNATSGESGWATTTCKIGSCMTFDGTNDYVDAGDNNSLNPARFSVEAWFYAENLVGNHDIISKGTVGGGITYFMMVSNEVIMFYVGGSSQVNSAYTSAIATSTWYHVVGVYDGANTKIYLNGNWKDDASTPLPPVSTSNNVYIGQRSGGSNFFDGLIDEVRIYNRALTADEIRTHYLRGANTNGAVLADKFRVIGTDNNINLQINGSGNSYLNTGYNFGIATTTPRYTLDVWGDMAVGTSTGVGTPMNYPLLYVNSGEGGSSNGVGIGTTTVSGTMLTVGTTTPALVVANNGYVGIGTANPSAYNINNFVIYKTGADAGMTIATDNNRVGIIYFADGTSGTEAYRGHVSYNHSADSMAFGTAAVTQMTINSSGDVGIGNTGPTSKLTVFGGDMVVSTAGSATSTISSATSTFAHGLIVDTNSLYVMADTGYVGIGTASPTTKLQVVGGSLAVGDTGQFYGHTNFPDVGASAEIGYTSALGYAFVQGYNRGASYVPMKIQGSTLGLMISGAEKMTIDTSGNVGIGTTGPSELLTVFSATDPTLQIGSGSATTTIMGNGTSTFPGGLIVDTSTLYLMSDSNRIGVATTTPRYTLDVWGSLAVGTSTSPIFLAVTGTTGTMGITVGADISMGSIQVASSSGAITFADMIIEASASAGTEESYSFQIDSSELFRIYAESDGAGGIQNKRVFSPSGVNFAIATTTPRYTLDVWGDLAVGTSTGVSAPMNYPLLYVNSGEGGSSNGVGIGTTTVSGTMLTVGTTTPALVVANNGYVGIGTANPETKLDVLGADLQLRQVDAAPIFYLRRQDTTITVGDTLSTIRFTGDDASVVNTIGAAIKGEADGDWASGDAPGRLTFWTALDETQTTYERMRINNAGNVGIGNTGPTSKLTVSGGEFAISTAGTATSTIYGSLTATSTIISGLSVGNNAALVVNQAATANSLYVAANGYVGIGTAAPGVGLQIGTTASSQGLAAANDVMIGGKLEVDGSTFFDGYLRMADNIYMNSNTAIGSLSGDWIIQTYNGDDNKVTFKARDNGVALVEVARLQGAADPYFQATNLYSMYSGNVGIATTSPRYKLDVWGDMAIGTSTGTNVPALYIDSGNGGQVGIGTTTLGTALLTVGTTTPALVVANNGYVGIGTASPTSLLTVAGDTYISGNVGIGTSTPYSKLTINESNDFAFGDFNASTVDTMEATHLNWHSNNSTLAATSSESTIVKTGGAALKIAASGACEDVAVRKIYTTAQNFSNKMERLSFWIYADKIATSSATTTQLISVGIYNSANGSNATSTKQIYIQEEDKWQYEEWNIFGLLNATSVDEVFFRIDVGNISTVNFYIDQIRLYNSNERSGEMFVGKDGSLAMMGRGAVEIGVADGSSNKPGIRVDSAVVEFNQPMSVNTGGDVGINYDLQFLNTGASYITSEGSLWIQAGDSNHAENLYLTTGGTGDVMVELSTSSQEFIVAGTSRYLDVTYAGVVGIGETSPLAFGDFNSQIIDNMEDSGLDWHSYNKVYVGTSTETSVVKVGSQALKIYASTTPEDVVVVKNYSPVQDWSAYERLSFWVQASQLATTTATTTQMISVGVYSSSNNVTTTQQIHIQKEDRWEYAEWNIDNIQNSTSVDRLFFRIDANDISTTNFYIDHIRLYDNDERAADLFVDKDGTLVVTGRNSVELYAPQAGAGTLPGVKVGAAVVELGQPLSVNVGGDVGMNNDLQFLSTGLSQITSEGPLRIAAGDSNHSENLTLTTGGTGDVIVELTASSSAFMVTHAWAASTTVPFIINSESNSTTTAELDKLGILFQVISDYSSDENTVFSIDASGNFYYDRGAYTPAADVAENYFVQDESIKGGDVVCLSENISLTVEKCSQSYQNNLIGVISTQPALLMGNDMQSARPVALAGRVPVKISLENGPIAIGDSLTSASSTPGAAMKATGSGKILGYALEAFGTTTGTGTPDVDGGTSGVDAPSTIYAFINLQDRSAGSLTVFENSEGNLEVQTLTQTGTATLFTIDDDGALVVDKIKTQQLCVGSVCVTENEFMQVFGAGVGETLGVSSSTPSVCDNGANRPCSSEVGACQVGVQVCTDGQWGECIGAVFPTEEIDDDVDNDCDGETDEGLTIEPIITATTDEIATSTATTTE